MVKCLYLLGPFHKYTVLLKSYKIIKEVKCENQVKSCVQNSGDREILSTYSRAEIAVYIIGVHSMNKRTELIKPERNHLSPTTLTQI
jgi:hypothetical protein